jgi:hypothetical protein
MQTANGKALAGGIIATCLVDTLVTKGLLTKADIGVLLGNAQQRLAGLPINPDIAAARDVISSIATGYAERGR